MGDLQNLVSVERALFCGFECLDFGLKSGLETHRVSSLYTISVLMLTTVTVTLVAPTGKKIVTRVKVDSVIAKYEHFPVWTHANFSISHCVQHDVDCPRFHRIQNRQHHNAMQRGGGSHLAKILQVQLLLQSLSSVWGRGEEVSQGRNFLNPTFAQEPTFLIAGRGHQAETFWSHNFSL